VCADAGWLAASPDGHVREEEEEGIQKGLLEIKCPYSKRIYPSIPEVCIQGFFFLSITTRNVWLAKLLL
jgi:hypothetical protein